MLKKDIIYVIVETNLLRIGNKFFFYNFFYHKSSYHKSNFNDVMILLKIKILRIK